MFIINQLTMDCPIRDRITAIDKTVLKCNHLFHKECIDKWFEKSQLKVWFFHYILMPSHTQHLPGCYCSCSD